MNSYKILKKQHYSSNNYSIVPIRYEDRYEIMQWRNEQMYHLRQNQLLTKEAQDIYIETVVSKLFEQEKPNQILFSFLENNTCIGYGGLVHINWKDSNAEISFIMDTQLEATRFNSLWETFLSLLEQVAFEDLQLHKIYTYAFDLRPKLYEVLLKANFLKEARLKEHVSFNSSYFDVLIHSKFNKKSFLRKVTESDIDITFRWASDPLIRMHSFNKEPITYEIHKQWFLNKLEDSSTLYFILITDTIPVGSIRFDIDKNKQAMISYQIDSLYQGKGLGEMILRLGINEIAKQDFAANKIFGLVHRDNKASLRIFEKLSFSYEEIDLNTLKYSKDL